MPPKIDAEPYRIDVPDSILADLDRRLAATRWPNQPDDARWQYGANRDYMQDLVAYWRDGFDWRKVERDLNEFTQYRAAIDDHLIHFIVEPGQGPAPLPLVVTHGWPSSFVEMLDRHPRGKRKPQAGGEKHNAEHQRQLTSRNTQSMFRTVVLFLQLRVRHSCSNQLVRFT